MNEQSIFASALEISDAAKRAAFLEAMCGDDPAMQERIEARLAADAAGGEATVRPTAQVAATADYRPAAETVGSSIGHYKLLQTIGEGGFGVVYMAEQQHPVRRKVALKIIKPGMDTKDVIARFESERQALALMDHPNIARVLDAGATASGRPYFVMELVKGVPITEYCDKNHATTEKRLELFVDVCHAVQHAHQKGVIHRDIKPSNVMVTLHDGKPVPKVIDFGVAKATSQQLTERTLFTAYGQMIGTPAYMSPEQAEMSGLDIDTRSDIYSLGVLLYELLTGTTPFDIGRLRDAGYVEMQRIIREEEPPRPSTRISTLGDKQTIVSSHRSTDPYKLRQALKGDLDVIVMKALDKERSRRYETPNSFAADLERYLRQEAILARPPSAIYRFRKFTQRNKAAVATAGAVFLCLLAGTISSTLLAIRATSERNRAEESLIETSKQRQAAEAATAVAQRERDRAEKANQGEVEERKKAEQQKQVAEEQRQLAEGQRKEAETAKQEAIAQRSAAETERDKATKLNEELNRQKEYQRRMSYLAQMSLIQKAWEADNIARVRELLSSTRPQPGEPDLRGFEWHYWQRMCHSELATLKLAAPQGTRSALAFSRDGTRLAVIESRSPRNEMQVWDTATGKLLLSKPVVEETRPPAGGGPASSAASAGPKAYRACYVDAQRVAISTLEYPVGSTANAKQPVHLRVVHLEDETKGFSLRVTTPAYASDPFTFNADGSRIAAIVFRGQEGNSQAHDIVQIWDGRTGQAIAQVAFPFALDSYSQRTAISPDGKQVAVLSRPTGLSAATAPRGGILVFDVESGKSATIGAGFFCRNLEFSPEGSKLAAIGAGSGPATVRVWNAATGEEVCRITDTASLSPSISGLVFSPDGATLATASRLGQQPVRSVRLWETTTGRQTAEFKGHIQSIGDVAFTNNGTQVLSGDAGGVIKSWQAPRGKPPAKPTVTLPLSDLAGAAKDALAKPGATASLGSVFKGMLEGMGARALKASGVVYGQIQAHSADGKWIAYSAGNSVVSSAGPNVMLLDTTDNTEPTTHYGLYGRGSLVSVTGKTKSAPLTLTGPLSFAFFSLDGTSLATASRVSASDVAKGVELKVWDVGSGDLRLSIQGAVQGSPTSLQSVPGAAEAIAFSPSGRLLAMNTTKLVNNVRKNFVQVWDVIAGRELYTIDSLKPIPGRPALRFSPDSSLLMTGSVDSLHAAPRASQVVGSTRMTISGLRSGIQIFDAVTGQLRWEESRSTSLAGFNSDGAVMAFMQSSGSGADAGPAVMVWDGQTGEQRSRISLERGQTYSKLALSHDGRRVAVASAPSDAGTGEVAIFDIESGERLLSLEGHNGLVGSVVFSPDDKRIATSAGVSTRYSGSSGGSGGETKVWDAATGQELLTLIGGSDVLTFSDRWLGADRSVDPFATAATTAWDASPLTPPIEAEEVVESLLVKGDRGRLLSRGKLAEQLKADQSLSEEVRTIALGLARGARRDANALNNEAWAIVKAAGAPPDEYVQALDYAVEACEIAPDRGAYANTLGVAHYRLGQHAESLTALEKAVSLHAAAKEASSPEDFLFLAMVHQNLGHGEQARTYFQQGDRAVQSFSSRKAEWSVFLVEAEALLAVPPASALITSGAAWRQKREYVKALADFDEAIRLDPQRASAYAYRGRTWSDQRDYDKALAEYDEAIRIDGKVAWFFGHRGYAWEQKGNRDQAASDFNEAIRLDPKYAWAFAQRAGIWRLRNDVDRALADYDEAIRLDSKVGWYFSERGIVWRMKGEYDKAIADYDVGIRLEPTATVHNNRGFALRQKGSHDEALIAYNEALRLNPNYATAYANRGSLWLTKGELDKALADYDEALHHSPRDSGYFNSRGRVRAQRQEYDKAIADFDEAIRLNPRSLAINSRALLLATCPDEKFRDGKRAVEEATKSCELSDWKDAARIDTLAAAYAECGNFGEAIKWCEQAISLATGSLKPGLEARLQLYREGKPYRVIPGGSGAAN